MLWSWLLAVIGVFGLYLTTRKMAAGFAVGVGVQALWITYAIVTAQYGFIFSALAFGTVNALGFYRWTTEKPESIPDKAIVMAPDSDLDRGFDYPTLPPHVFNHKGEPKWDIYPHVEVWGDRVLIGPTTKRTVLTANESHTAGRALLESADFIFNKSIEEQKK